MGSVRDLCVSIILLNLTVNVFCACISGITFWGYSNTDFTNLIRNSYPKNISSLEACYGSSARWDGYFTVPFSGVFKIFLRTVVDSTTNVYINNKKIISFGFYSEPDDRVVGYNYGNVTLSNSTLHRIKVEFQRFMTTQSSDQTCIFEISWWYSCEYPLGQIPSAYYFQRNCTGYTLPALPARKIIPSNYVASQGLSGYYYLGTNFTELVYWRVDQNINFSWSTVWALPGNCLQIYEFISIMWQGFLVSPQSGNTRLEITSDDGSTLEFMNRTIDNWRIQTITSASHSFPLIANTLYPIRLRFFNTREDGTFILKWNDTIVPSSALRPLLPPTVAPTVPPTRPPTPHPTIFPTSKPTHLPSHKPTNPPTIPPTEPPTIPPTEPPTIPPTVPPTEPPTIPPTVPPTIPPTVPPTVPPTISPTNPPTFPPTEQPTWPTIEFNGVVVIDQHFLVSGNLLINENATLRMHQGTLSVTGCVNLGGKLEVYLPANQSYVEKESYSILLVKSSCFSSTGDFISVDVITKQKCLIADPRLQENGFGLSVVFTIRNQCSSGLKVGIIVAIVVSVVVFILIAVVVVSVPSIRTRVFPFSLE